MICIFEHIANEKILQKPLTKLKTFCSNLIKLYKNCYMIFRINYSQLLFKFITYLLFNIFCEQVLEIVYTHTIKISSCRWVDIIVLDVHVEFQCNVSISLFTAIHVSLVLTAIFTILKKLRSKNLPQVLPLIFKLNFCSSA